MFVRFAEIKGKQRVWTHNPLVAGSSPARPTRFRWSEAIVCWPAVAGRPIYRRFTGAAAQVVKPPPARGVPKPCVRCTGYGGAGSRAGCPRGGCPARLTCTLLPQLVANNFVSRLSDESAQSAAARFARVQSPATFSRILPPRRRCCTASWMCSRGYTPATGTTRAPSATSGAASRMTGITLSR
jgi:hypothetical protein